ncbi:hypothetical protein [Serratia entomophila]|uniref:hypothetical protein n=1 Tax=Serratia entomophila TaxID=42906 RepID=UPI0021B82301|nr:hypothetical protein [Serratia entomophila]
MTEPACHCLTALLSPPLSCTPAVQAEEKQPESGSADAFLPLIEQQIKPAVAAQAAVDTQQLAHQSATLPALQVSYREWPALGTAPDGRPRNEKAP